MIRIARLDLERWGHFDGRQLTFGPAGRLHVVFGANEAGKSTTRRAVSALLFGVPERTVDTFGRPGADLRVGALLELDGTAVEVVRRKGRKNTLLDAEGEVLDPAPLDRALGGLSGEVHAGLFEITHDSLVQGGHELLAGRGAVGESLFAAAAGTSRLHALLRRLEGDADAVFTPLGRKKDLNKLLALHAEAVRTLRDAALRPPQHEALARALEGLETAYARAGAELDEVERERARLERLRGALPLAALRATRARELEELGEVAALAADAPARRTAAQERRDAARARGAAAQRDLERRQTRFAALAVDEGLLPFVTELEELHAQGTAVAQDAARREDLAAQRTALAPRLEELLGSLSVALGGRSLRELALDDDARARLEQCLQTRAGVQQTMSAAREGLIEAAWALERAQRAADEAPTEIDDATLTAVLRAARAAGSVDDDAARSRAEERSALAAAEQAAAQMRPRVGAAHALATLPVPDRATVEQLLVDIVEAEQVAEGLALEGEGIEDRVRLLERQRDQLAAEAPVLDASALERARSARTQTWEAVREALACGIVAEDATRLATEHERAVTAADEVADARLQRAEDVARLTQVERELAVLAHDAQELAHRRKRHAAASERAAAAWSAAWAPAGAHAPAPAEAGAWLAARDTVLAHLADAASAAERAEAAEALRAQHRNALHTVLDADADAELPLSALIELADARLDALRAEAEQAARAAEALERAVGKRELAEVMVGHAEGQLAEWRDEWASLRTGCGLADTL